MRSRRNKDQMGVDEVGINPGCWGSKPLSAFCPFPGLLVEKAKDTLQGQIFFIKNMICITVYNKMS